MERELRRRGLVTAQGDPLRAIDELHDLLYQAHRELSDGVPTPFNRWLSDDGPAGVVKDIEMLRLGHEYSAELVADQHRVEVEQAWRNGWGSALNCLRGADQIVKDNQVGRMAIGDRATQRIFHRMVDQWIVLIDGLVEDVLSKCREIGLASTPEASTDLGESESQR